MSEISNMTNKENIHHLSEIRIGNRIIYNGVNGDAFSFGEKPCVRATKFPPDKDFPSTTSLCFSIANGSPPAPPDKPAIATKQINLSTTAATIPTATASKARSVSTSSLDLAIPQSTKKSTTTTTPQKISGSEARNQQGIANGTPPKPAATAATVSLTPGQSPPRESQSPPKDLHVKIKPLPPLSVSLPASPSHGQSFTLPPPPLTPAAVGLPPVLPPPPAAHLPPPLPARPPSGAPSRSSSISSLASLRLDDKLYHSTPPHSPGFDSTMSQTGDPYSNSNYSYLTGIFFRSSGTIKVEAPSRDFPAPTCSSPTSNPASPPPLPLPSSAFSSPSHSAPSSAAVTPLTARRATASADTALGNGTASAWLSPPTPGGTSPASSAASSMYGSDDEDGEFVDDDDIPSAKNCEALPYIKSSNKPWADSQLVSTREKGAWMFQKQRPRSNTDVSDVNRNIIPPEFEKLRKSSMGYADVITSALVFYKFKKAGKRKKIDYVQPKLEKAANCRKCGRAFGLRCFRYHCSRCKKSFCDRCIPIVRYDDVDQEDKSSSLTRVCDPCREEIAYETSRGRHRGLWTEFQKMRAEARANRGLDNTSVSHNKQLESQSMLDVTPGLRSLCFRFLVEVHQQLEKQHRHKFLANYLHFENPAQARLKGKVIKTKECQACHRQLRMLTDIRDCSICDQTFCMLCTYKTLQLYLPAGTDLKGVIDIEMIKFHVKENEQAEEVDNIEASETYRVCAGCEDVILWNLRVLEFDQKIPEIEAEMFDLQRQIDHALTYGPHMYGMQRSVSAASIYHMKDNDPMTTNIRIANRLYDRYMRAYDNLNHMSPQTPGQKALHKHIKQAMYDFYIKRRDQLKSTLRRRDSCTGVGTDSMP